MDVGKGMRVLAVSAIAALTLFLQGCTGSLGGLFVARPVNKIALPVKLPMTVQIHQVRSDRGAMGSCIR